MWEAWGSGSMRRELGRGSSSLRVQGSGDTDLAARSSAASSVNTTAAGDQSIPLPFIDSINGVDKSLVPEASPSDVPPSVFLTCKLGSSHSVAVTPRTLTPRLEETMASGPLSPARSSSRESGLKSTVASSNVRRDISKYLAATVNFRDVSFITKEAPSVEGACSEYTTLCTGVQKHKLIIIMVGLPGRGKTFLCNKLMAYLNWLGHVTRHFNVGQYRRCQKLNAEIQDASFFDVKNPAGLEARNRALYAALDDMLTWLEEDDDSQVAIFDATNSTEERRQLLRKNFHNRFQYLCIEMVCEDEEILRQNYLNKMRYSPDYTGMNMEKAMEDFKTRIKKYEEVYQSLEDRSFHWIKLINMITGRGYMDINRISGYIPGKIVFYLMQVCRTGLMGNTRKIWLTRHGQSEYNRLEKLGGNSDISEDGERYASLLPHALLSRLPEDECVSVGVWTSTLKRTIQTARHLPFPKLQWKALDEIDAGTCDGMTYEEIADKMPEEFQARKRDKLRYRYPAGESYCDVIARCEPVITEVERERESVVIVSHQAVLRVIIGYLKGVPQEQIPTLEIPLHTLIELTPLPDGTMREERFPVNINAGPEQFTSRQLTTQSMLPVLREAISNLPEDVHHGVRPATSEDMQFLKSGLKLVEVEVDARPGSPDSSQASTTTYDAVLV